MSSTAPKHPFDHDDPHILFATDGSEDSEKALHWMLGIAAYWEARVTVVCAFDSPKSFRKRGSIALPEVRDHLEAEASEILAETVASFAAAGVQATAIAYEGSLVDALLEVVDRDRPDMIVVGGGDREGVRDYLIGTDVERIVRHSPVPVCVIK